MGGAPEATAIPSENGTETIETTSPASRSCRQCFSPARPFCGFSAAIIAVSSISHHSPECRGNVRSGNRSSTPDSASTVRALWTDEVRFWKRTRYQSSRRRVPGTISRRSGAVQCSATDNARRLGFPRIVGEYSRSRVMRSDSPGEDDLRGTTRGLDSIDREAGMGGGERTRK